MVKNTEARKDGRQCRNKYKKNKGVLKVVRIEIPYSRKI